MAGWYLFISFILWYDGVHDRLGNLLAHISLKVPIKAFGLSMQVLVVQLQLESILLITGFCKKAPSFHQVLRTFCGRNPSLYGQVGWSAPKLCAQRMLMFKVTAESGQFSQAEGGFVRTGAGARGANASRDTYAYAC